METEKLGAGTKKPKKEPKIVVTIRDEEELSRKFTLAFIRSYERHVQKEQEEKER